MASLNKAFCLSEEMQLGPKRVRPHEKLAQNVDLQISEVQKSNSDHVHACMHACPGHVSWTKLTGFVLLLTPHT